MNPSYTCSNIMEIHRNVDHIIHTITSYGTQWGSHLSNEDVKDITDVCDNAFLYKNADDLLWNRLVKFVSAFNYALKLRKEEIIVDRDTYNNEPRVYVSQVIRYIDDLVFDSHEIYMCSLNPHVVMDSNTKYIAIVLYETSLRLISIRNVIGHMCLKMLLNSDV